MHVVIPGNSDERGFYFFFLFLLHTCQQKKGVCLLLPFVRPMARGYRRATYMDGLGQGADGKVKGETRTGKGYQRIGFLITGGYYGKGSARRRRGSVFYFLVPGSKQAGPIDVCIWEGASC